MKKHMNIIVLISVVAAVAILIGAFVFWKANNTASFDMPLETVSTFKKAIRMNNIEMAKSCFTSNFQTYYSEDITKKDFYYTEYWTGGPATLDQLFENPPLIKKDAIFKIEEETDNTAVVGIYYGGIQENKESVLKEIPLIKENGLWKINDLYGRMDYVLSKKEIKENYSYGEIVTFSEEYWVQFPDFKLVYLGIEEDIQREMMKDGTVMRDKLFPITYHKFLIKSGTEIQEVSWSFGTGDLGPAFFEINGGRYFLYMHEEVSSTNGETVWLSEKQLVITREEVASDLSSSNATDFVDIKYTVLPSKDDKGITLTDKEVATVKSLLVVTLQERKGSLKPLEDYKFQFSPKMDENGEKVISVYAFCDDLGMDWKKEIISPFDGGNCYFNLRINIDTKEVLPFLINSEA